MPDHGVLQGELPVANVTLVGPLAKVCANVILHVGELVESFVADVAGKLLVKALGGRVESGVASPQFLFFDLN